MGSPYCGMVAVRAALLLAIFLGIAARESAAQENPAALRPGDRLQVIDGGVLKDVEFVELTPAGLIKVRFEDDSQKPFKPNFVRRHPKAKPSSAPAVAAEAKGIGGKRTWTDTTGQFKIEAAFVAIADGQVKLKKLDGKIISLPLDKLSAEDQSIAETFAKGSGPEQPAEALPLPKPGQPPNEVATTDVPPRPGRPGTPDKEPRTSGKEPAVPTAVLPDLPASVDISADAEKVIRHQAKTAPPLNFKDATFVAVPPDPLPAAGQWLTKLNLPRNSREGRNELSGFEIDATNNLAWLSIKTGDASSRLERFDLVTGQALPVFNLRHEHKLDAIAPTGAIVATRPQAKPTVDHQFSGVAFWRVEPSGALKLMSQLVPFDKGTDRRNESDAIGTILVTADGIAVLESWGVLLWDIAANKAVGYREARRLGGCAIAQSPGGKYVAIAGFEGLYLVEPRSGKVLSRLMLPGMEKDKTKFYSVGFSDDGTQVAVASTDSIWILNLADGQCVKQVSGLVLEDRSGALTFTPNHTLTFRGVNVFDYEREIMLGTITMSRRIATARGRRFGVDEGTANGKELRSLVSHVVPNDDVERAAQAAADKLIVHTRPGSTISVVIRAGNYKVDADALRKVLEEKCTKNGWKPVPAGTAAEYTMTASFDPHTPEEVAYTVIGRERTVEHFTVTTIKEALTICPAGSSAPIWQRGHVSGPFRGSTTLRPDEKVADYVTPKPRPDLFALMAIPAKIVQYPSRDALLQIDCDEQGVSVRLSK